MSNLLKQFQESSAFYGGNATFIEGLYEQFLDDPDAVSESWREKFISLGNGTSHEIAHSPIVDRFEKLAKSTQGRLAKTQGFTEESVKKQSAVARLINHYRMRGHQIATNNPLGNAIKTRPDLEFSYYGLAEPDMDTYFDTDSLYGVDKLPLRKIISTLKEIYCGSIGSEYMHIPDADTTRWIKNKLEGKKLDATTHCKEKKTYLLKTLTAAEGIEKHLHRKYVGQKRFSLEGSECLIPVLDELIQTAGDKHVKEIVIGMAHRGRLNVLINILGKSPAQLFGEFEGTHTSSPSALTGDVKYHMGFSSNIATLEGSVHLTLGFNPSHLEIINPVIEGSVKARQDRRGKGSVNAIIPILIHGDAAFAGQGIVMETLNMSETHAFSTGGTIHIVINNQIGFTTSNPFDARSTLYCTDVATMIHAPVFHVNGDDPEAVIFVTQLALEYRMKFNKDVVIDLICYRRLGHNEADEPATTQPMMYKTIRKLPSVREIYAKQLIDEKILTEQTAQQMVADYQQLLDEGKPVSRPALDDSAYHYSGQWQRYEGQDWTVPCNTQVSLDEIRLCSDKIHQLPAEFELHPRVAKVMENRLKMSAGALPIDWGFAENLAYATLITQCKGIRLIGQDVGRGTFSHRHIALHNQLNGETYFPIQHIAKNQGRAQIFDSLLSEAGVLGFEFGYSSTEPEKLVIWEAQFGDFANGAQVVIDQFISSAETKWGRLCGLVMLLPHGFEGQGPEHSSARLERYLQLCADHNIQVCCPTTPAQIFHLLRRQQLRPYRKPLIVMSPKSLLRHKQAVSTLEDLTDGEFQCVIPEQSEIDPQQVTRIVMCSGKVYYDLIETRNNDNLKHIAIIRIEQLYPFPNDLFTAEIDKYPHINQLIWCQEEPKNQGAWYQSKHHFYGNINKNITIYYAGRAASAAPAVGSLSAHIKQQRAVIQAALYDTNEGS
ncbi:MAG: 2-oxoglutarate dehydrogenase E1 component [Methylococcales symbiont of Iophon sp. n. MRB-2018]|nr:MAG: 2-oxoglutarate dehydrogenase E1 component [Methylococcales symbiont of Iophon sp. n. MRB-2018]KAF3979523.1 MAG: 2-oxoglutarate dehydrogenase E1 component [Methylococcales symbiont of Iophon sp. n. MRB-2018]